MKPIYDRAQHLKRQAPLGLLADALECIEVRAVDLPDGSERQLALAAIRALQAAMGIVQAVQGSRSGVFDSKRYR